MNGHALSPNQKRLNAIRRRVADAMPDWTLLAADGQVIHYAGDGPDGERVMIVADAVSYENRDFALNVVADFFFLLAMYDKLTDRFRAASVSHAAPAPAARGASKPADYAAECAMRCAEPLFQSFLAECHGIDVSDAERIKLGIRKALDVASRGDLNRDAEAARRWRHMVGDFESWGRDR